MFFLFIGHQIFFRIKLLQNNSNVESEQYQEQATTTTGAAAISPVVVQPDVPTCLSQPPAVGITIPLASGMTTQNSSENRANIQYKIGIN